MSKIKLTGSNSGYVEIDSAADAGNLTLSLPTSGTRLLSNTDNVFSGITTTGQLDINGSIDVSSTSVFNNDLTLTGASYNVVWDKSDNQLEFGDDAKLSFGAAPDSQFWHDGNNTYIHHSGTGDLITRIAKDNGYFRVYGNGNTSLAHFRDNYGVELFYNSNKKFETTNTGAVVTGICTATSFSGSGENLTRTTQLSHRNLIINGAMMVAQRGSSTTSSNAFLLDRFKVQFGGHDEACTVEQANVASGTTPYTLGFLKCLKITNGNQTGANTADYLEIYTALEDQDICNSGWNFKSDTSYLTISFWVKSSVAQKFSGFLYTNQAGQGDSYMYSYQIDNGSGGNLSANTWTKITHSIPGASGLTFNNDNTRGLSVGIFPFNGTDYTTSGHTDGAWAGWNTSNKLKDMTSTWWTTNDATFEITGLQLEVGQQATPFEHRSFSEELTRCQRYYQVGSNIGAGYGSANGYARAGCTFATQMRTTPTFTATNTGSGSIIATGRSNTGFYVTYGSLSGTSAGIFSFVAESEV